MKPKNQAKDFTSLVWWSHAHVSFVLKFCCVALDLCALRDGSSCFILVELSHLRWNQALKLTLPPIVSVLACIITALQPLSWRCLLELLDLCASFLRLSSASTSCQIVSIICHLINLHIWAEREVRCYDGHWENNWRVFINKLMIDV